MGKLGGKMPIYTNPLDPATGTSLSGNQQINVYIAPNTITDENGETNTSAIRVTFLTVATPVYASVDYIILDGGESMEAVPEAAIYATSFAASVLVDDIVLFDPDEKFPDKTTRAWRFFSRARTEFVKCKSIADLLRAIISNQSSSAGRKLLADFSVDNSNLAGLMTQSRPLLKDFIECYQYWQKVLFAGGAVDFESPMAKSAVKAGYEADGFGGIGRGWIADSDNLNYREAEGITGNRTTRPRRFGYRNPLSDIHES